MSKKKIIVENELSSLDKAIGYAEAHAREPNYEYHDPSIVPALMKIHAGQHLAYQEFLRMAWGKAVRINSEYRGEVIFRVSQAAAIIPGINVATPYSPIGRLVNIARSGDAYKSIELGEYTIDDVWFFERYVGHEYLENIKNFKEMTSQGENNFTIKNLLGWLKNFDKQKIPIKSTAIQDDIEISPWNEVIFEDSEEEAVDMISDSENEQNAISLSTVFYVNLSKHQYDAAHSGTNGLVFVFGVAGSGKTSVALGRSKSLSQLGQLPKDDKLYNQDFPEESQIGVVRTGELITYLKDTCNMLSLHRLPVVEYRDIYEELKAHWNIEQFNNNTAKYFLAKTNSISSNDSKMEWFRFISEEMINVISEKILASTIKEPKKVANIDGNIFSKININVSNAIRYSLKNNDPIGFLSRIENSIEKVIEKIFTQLKWVGIPSGNSVTWLINEDDNVAAHIISEHKIMCLYGGIHNIQILIPEVEKQNWQEWVPSSALVSHNDSAIPERISIPIDDSDPIVLNIKLASNGTITQCAKDGTLRFYKCIGERTRTVRTERLLLGHMPRIVSSNEYKEGSEKNTREWRKKIRSRVLGNIRRPFINIQPSDLFAQAIERLNDNGGGNGRYISTLKEKYKQIKDNRLTESDIDLIVAFMAAITRREKINSLFSDVPRLKPAPYRSSVFIDEVQDFSEIQVYLLSLLSNPKYNSVTAVGDSAQCLYTTTSDISASFPKNMWESSHKQELTDNIRQQHIPTVSALSAAYRNKYIDDVFISVEEYKKNSCLMAFNYANSIDQLRKTYKIISNIPKSETIVIVVPSIEYAKEAIKKLKPHLRERQHRECNYSRTIDLTKRYVAHVTTPRNIKGLEFDHLIALYLDEYNLSDVIDKNSIYVMMSRPKKSLSLLMNVEKMDLGFVQLIEQFVDIQ